MSLQGAEENIITITGKLKAFESKLQLWISKSKTDTFDFLPSVNASGIKHKISQEIPITLENLLSSFAKYFPSLNSKQNEWVVNPFANSAPDTFTTEEEEQFIDLKNDLILKSSFLEVKLAKFWISMISQYRELSTKAIRALLPFGSSYLCELGFSSLNEIKSKKRERLQMIDAEMRVCLSNIEPRIAHICSLKQAHTSH